MAYTRVQFRDEIRQRLGWSATDTFAVDTELNNYINEALEELHALLVTVHKPGTFGTIDTGIIVSAGQSRVVINGPISDFGRVLKVMMQWQDKYVPFAAGDRVTDLQHINPIEWTPYKVRYYVSIDGANTALWFDWPPLNNTLIILTYIRRAPILALDADTSWLGWDEYVILDVMLKCRDKEDDDGGALVQKKAHLEQRIRNHAEPVDMGHASTVVDMRAQDYYHDDYDHGWWRRWG